MKRARAIDPTTHDFVRTPGRRFASGDPLLNKLVLAYQVPLGTWEGDPAIGHRFGELARWKNDAGARTRLHDLAVEAAGWLIADGDLERVEVTVEEYSRGKLAFEVQAYPPGALQPVPFGPVFVPVAT